MGIVDVDLGSVIAAGGNILDDLFTSDEEKLALGIQEKQIDASLKTGQMEINKAEASHKSIFVAGARPAILLVCALALGYQYLLFPILVWGWTFFQAMEWIPTGIAPPPAISAEGLYPIISGMLGFGVMRTVEGIKGVKTNALTPPVVQKKSGFKWPWSKS